MAHGLPGSWGPAFPVLFGPLRKLRQLPLMILQQDTRLLGSLRCKRKQAGWNNDLLETLLAQISDKSDAEALVCSAGAPP